MVHTQFHGIFVLEGIELMAFGIASWITHKILYNLYEFCTMCEECNGFKIIGYLQFSDYHNWKIKPSKSNKIYALIVPLSIMISTLFSGILYIWYQCAAMTKEMYYLINFIPCSFAVACQTFYFLYMCSTLQYYMDSNELIKNMISNKLIMITKAIAIFIALYYFGIYCWWILIDCSFEIQNFLMEYIFGLCTRMILEIILLYSYYSGLNNVCHYWYSKYPEEYMQYGENEPIHEILISITRCTTIIIVSSLANILSTLVNIIQHYIIAVYCSSESIYINMGYWMVVMFARIDDIFHCFAIYFVYEFGHIHYEKFFSKCHNKLYSYFQRKHQKEVENGLFDGKIYHSNRKNCNCGWLWFIKQPRVTEEIEITHDHSQYVILQE